MGYFDKTLLGKMVLPRHKKVAGWLDDAYEYKVHTSLEEVFKAFCEQQKSLGFSTDETALLWIAVQINALTGVLDKETKEWVIMMNRGAFGTMPYLSNSMQREIAETYIEASSKHLTEEEIKEIWGG